MNEKRRYLEIRPYINDKPSGPACIMEPEDALEMILDGSGEWVVQVRLFTEGEVAALPEHGGW